MRIGRWGGIAAAAAALVALGACGNPIAHLTTERGVGDSVGKALAQPGLNLQISLGATPAQLLEINRIEHGDSSFTPQVASALSHTSIVVNVYPGHGESVQSEQFAADPNNRLQLAIQVRGARPVDVRYFDGSLYARTDIHALLADFGQSPAAAAGARSGLEKADAYLPGLAALGQGQWVSANLHELAPLLKLGGLNLSRNNQYQASSTALMRDLKSALINNTSYTNLGNHGGRTEYGATVAAHHVLQQLSGDLSSLAGSTPIPGVGDIGKQMAGSLDKVPQTVALQLWVKDNKMQEVDIDLNQFAHKYPFAVPLRVMIAAGSPVAVPRGATPLQISGIAGLLGGLGGLRPTPGPTQAS
jgi:hypothetical protein